VTSLLRYSCKLNLSKFAGEISPNGSTRSSLVAYTDLYSFLEEVASHFAGDDENLEQTEQEIVLAAIANIADDKLTSFALRLALTDHLGMLRDPDPTCSPKPTPHSLHHRSNNPSPRVRAGRKQLHSRQTRREKRQWPRNKKLRNHSIMAPD